MDVLCDTTRPETLKGTRVSFVGRLASMTRRAVHDTVESAGGVATMSISGRTTHVVIGMHGWPLRADGSVSMKLQEAERRRERTGRPSIISETRFLELVRGGEADPHAGDADPAAGDGGIRKSYGLEQVANLVGVDRQTIERWEYLGLVESEDGAYDFQDIVSLQAIAGLVQRGVEPRRIRESLGALASFLPGTERPLAQLTVVASDTGELLAQVGDTLVTPDGQQLLEYTVPEAIADAAVDQPPAELEPGASTDDLFDRALWLEEEERYDEAADTYRRAIALAPGRPALYFNLGNVLRTSELLEAAEELYRLTVALAPDGELGWYNLADVQEEMGAYEDAVESLYRAVKVCPTFADGHFNLAGCLERLDRNAEAQEHWRAYLELDRESEWAGIARRRLEAFAGGRGAR